VLKERMKTCPFFLPQYSTPICFIVKLESFLSIGFIHQHVHDVGKRDQAHNVLAMVIIYSIWCGWLSQAKANRGIYPQVWDL
jgi:hypothetical protein